jgi:hypothetical protein
MWFAKNDALAMLAICARRGTLLFSLPNNQRQHHTLHVKKDVLPYALR